MSMNGQSISSSKLCYILGWVEYQNGHPDVVFASYKPGFFFSASTVYALSESFCRLVD